MSDNNTMTVKSFTTVRIGRGKKVHARIIFNTTPEGAHGIVGCGSDYGRHLTETHHEVTCKHCLEALAEHAATAEPAAEDGPHVEFGITREEYDAMVANIGSCNAAPRRR